MKKIVKENPEIKRFELPVDEAIALMESKNEPYKIELIKEHAEKANRSVFMSKANLQNFAQVLTLWI